MVASRILGSNISGASGRSGRGGCHHRCLCHASPPGFCGRKRGIESNALGRSRGGVSTKVHALVDTQGRPLHIELTPGQQHESTVAESIITQYARGKKLIADTGYDSNALRACVRERGMTAVIHPSASRKQRPRLNRKAYRIRYMVEVFFHNLKRFRGLATRFEKTARHYLSQLHVVCSLLWLPQQ